MMGNLHDRVQPNVLIQYIIVIAPKLCYQHLSSENFQLLFVYDEIIKY